MKLKKILKKLIRSEGKMFSKKYRESLNRKKTYEFQGFQYVFLKQEIKILSYHGQEKELHIPEKIENKKVTIIEKEAFKGNKRLEKVFLPESIEVVREAAFSMCKNLKYVYLPVDLESIPIRCFYGCSALLQVQIPCELKKIGKEAFKNCSNLILLKSYVKSGISAVKKVRKDLEDCDLPVELSYIGEEAFCGCRRLERIAIPYRVTKILEKTFYGCESMQMVTVHNRLKKVENEAFAKCRSLKRMRISQSVTSIGKDVFSGTEVSIICEKDSEICRYAQKYGIKKKILSNESNELSSMMRPYQAPEEYKPYYTKKDAQTMEEKCELRPAVIDKADRKRIHVDQPHSRYILENGIYKSKDKKKQDHAKIFMTGDLMCKQNHQNYARQDGKYCFEEAFQYVKEILKTGDLVIGNMESMAAPSLPYTCESPYVNGRPYLNAPEEFITAIKKAGYDAVVNAQNHIYDVGTLGILETLEVLNRNQLMHTGAFVSEKDKRYLSIEVNGIRIAVLSYFDGARQLMKKANFTEYGKKILFSMHEKEQIQKDVAAAKADGVEFIIAYCHWGREYTHDLTQRQMNFAQEVVDAGVDYIMGAHAHCLQPYSVLVSKDGRLVPVIYSAGNFLSEISINPKITRDTIIASLELIRNEDGKVVIKEEGYYPCRILRDKGVKGEFVIVPTNKKFAGKVRNQALKDAEARIEGVMGRQYKKIAGCVESSFVTPVENTYTLKEPWMVKIKDEQEELKSDYSYHKKKQRYERNEKLETKEAVLMCAGQIQYDSRLGDSAKFGEVYNFRPYFKLMKRCLEKADLSIGNLTAMVCDEYLSTEMMDPEYNPNPYYTNARKEYLNALKYAGFDCLAVANPNNMDTGVNGIQKTIENIDRCGMFSVGIGLQKNKIFKVNGISIGIVSYTLDCYDWYKFITGEGADKLLNIYSKEKAQRDIRQMKNAEVDFVLVYINCGSSKEKIALKGRKEIGMEIAEAGADYVICTIPDLVSKYYRYKTKNGRKVPIATSLGTLMSGEITEENKFNAILKLILYKTEDGTIEINDTYIPMKRFETLENLYMPVVPALSCYYDGYKVENFPKVKKSLTEKMGDDILVSEERKVKMGTRNRPQLTYQEIYDILGCKVSREDQKKIDLEKKAPIIATRKSELEEGCVAVLVKYYGYKKSAYELTLEDAIQKKAALIISQKECTEIPCIVVQNCKTACKKIYRAITAKYNPITVAITGTAGKTTTKELMSCVFDTHYRTLHVEGNNNTFYSAGTTVQKLSKEDQAYIQEVHGGSKYSARNISNMIRPDIAIITNIGEGHLLDMGSMENVIKGKLEIASGLKNTGVLVVNDDNEYLKDLKLPGKRILRYSMYHKSCDYYAQNIEDMGNAIKFEIVCSRGCFHAMLNLQGIHNVGNALGVFACAIEAGIPPYKIIAGLTHYKPEEDKQNLLEFHGYRMIIDTYSATPLSVETAMKTLENLPIAKGGKKIAVLGDIPALGDFSEDKHKEVGEKICKYEFDLMLCIGKYAKYFALAAIEAGKQAFYYEEDREAFNQKLSECITPGDLVLFKSGTRSHLKEETIYPLFGLIDKK